MIHFGISNSFRYFQWFRVVSPLGRFAPGRFAPNRFALIYYFKLQPTKTKFKSPNLPSYICLIANEMQLRDIIVIGSE